MHPMARTGLRWSLRLLLALVALALALAASSPWTVPHWLRREIPRIGQQQLGRVVQVGPISFNPLRLRLQIDDLRVREAGAPSGSGSGAQPDALLLRHGVLRLDWSSLWGLHPRVGELLLQGLQLRLVRDATGRLDIDDLLRRLARRPATPGAAPVAFALDVLELRDGSVLYEDRASGVRSRLAHLGLRLTRLSTLSGADGALHAQAHALLDGAPLQLRVDGHLLGPQRSLRASLHLQDLALGAWRALQPASWAVRLHSGTLATKLQLDWTAGDATGPRLSGDVRLRGLQLRHAGQPFVELRQADLGLRSVLPLRHEVDLGTLRIDGVRATLDRAQWRATKAKKAASGTSGTSGTPGTTGATGATGAPPGASTAPAGSAAVWHVQWAGLQVQDAQAHWHDATLQPALDWQFSMPQLQAGPGQWPLRAPVQARLQLLGPKGLQLLAQGTLASARDALQLRIQGLRADLARAYAAPWLHGAALPGGTLQANLDVLWQAHLLRVDLPLARWSGFDWAAAGGAGPRARQIVLRNASLHWTPGGAAPGLRAAELDIEQPASGRGAGLRAAGVQLHDLGVDLAAHRVQVGRLEVLKPLVSLARDSSGRWSVGDWLPAGLLPAHHGASTAEPPRHGASRAAPPPWSLQLGAVRVRDGSAYLADTYPRQAVVLAASAIDAELHGFDWPLRKPAGFSIQARLRDARQAPAPQTGAAAHAGAQGGTLRLRGSVAAAPWRVRAQVVARDLPAQVAADYLPRWNARVLRARGSADGRLDVRAGRRGLQLGFDGDAAVTDLAVDTVQPDADLLAWQALRLQRLHLRIDPQARPRLDIAQVVLHDFRARLSLSRHARLNVLQVLRPAAPAKPPAASGPAPRATPRRTLRVRIGGIVLDHGRVNWTDHFVQPNYSTSLTDVHGSIGSFASDSPTQADVDLRAVAEGTAAVALAGKANPLLSPPQLDLRARVDDLQLAPLTPYSRRYAGYGIERGLLSMNVHYDIDAGGRLQADNRLVLRQLTFGAHVPSPTATRLPLLLAVDLLKDRNGNIHLDIPISGSLHDPEFSLGSVIGEAVAKLLLRAVTAPFSLMGHMFQGGKPPPQLDVVPFAAGSAHPGGADMPRLRDIARLLQAKPRLVVTITGHACVDETAAYRQAVLERQLLAQWRSDLPRAEAYAHAHDRRVPADARAQALAALYRNTALPDKPRNALGLARGVPPDTMQRLLLRAIPGGQDHLLALAMRRAVALRDALNGLGVPALRQFIAAPEVARDAGCQPSARLSVSLP